MSSDGFHERARQEAERYGADPWVFVRELLQNARDAGAATVALTAERRAGRDVVTCRDDGCGMSLEDARRFLFTLYASSKRRDRGVAGRFGVGFWSVLRFEPDRITVRSRPADGDGWEVVLDGGLGTSEPAACVMFPGTEVVLERTARGDHPLPMILEAAHRDARYLRLRGGDGRLLEVTVNGRRTTEELALPAPSLSFRRPGLRGAVALGDEARVDVLAHGLRVRSAPFLDELLLAEEAVPPAVELAEGLLPRVVLDSDRLEVLLARGDVGEGAALRRAVAVAQGELRRLVRSELDRSAPLRGPRRWLERATEMWRAGRTLPLLSAAVAGVVLGVGLALVAYGRGAATRAPAPSAAASAPPRSVAGLGLPLLYRDLAASYRGPAVDALDDRRPVALTYAPATASPWLAALRLTGPADGGAGEPLLAGPYRGAPCHEGCLDVDLEIDAAAGPLRIPLATGHRLDPESVRLDGAPVTVATSTAGEPVVVLDEARRGLLRYRSGPAIEPEPPAPGDRPSLPAGLAAAAARLRLLPPAERVAAAVQEVVSRVRYDRSPPVVERHRAAVAAGTGALERALAIGAGDCDVQNLVLAALLDATGLDSRLAIGFVGRAGRAVGGVHAWVEVLEDGRWRVADASMGAVTARDRAPTDSSTMLDEPARATVSTSLPGAPSGRLRNRWLAGAGVALLALLGWLVLAAWRRHGGRDAPVVTSSGQVGLAPLLRAALLRPRAWSRVEAVYLRPLVPAWGRRPLSLRRVLAAARRGRLYRATGSSDMVRRAVRRAVVIDGSREEGRVVADLLGAVDLDRWQGVLEEALRDEAVARMEDALRRAGLRAHLCVVPRWPEPLAVIDGGPFGCGRGSRLVVIDAGGPLWAAVAGAAERRPEWAALLLGDEITERAPVVRRRRSRVLGELARSAVEGARA